jgi:hypothetical protein
MPRLTILLLSLMLGAGAAVLASCGGDDGPDGPGIPSADAEGMLAELERARAAFEAGDCLEVQESAQQIADNAANLADADPPLDPEIQDALTQGAEHLGELATTSSECAQEPTTTTTDEDKTTTTEPTTTTSEPTTTEETTTTTTTEEQPPPSDDGGSPPGQSPGPPSNAGPGGTGTGGVGEGDR